MPAEETSPAIVLRTRDYAESDRIVTVLTRDAGKISGIAKGAKVSRYRFERRLEPMSHVVLHFRRRPHGQLVFITRAEAADLRQHLLDDDLGKIALASYMLELTDALTAEEGESSIAYQTLESGLRAVAHTGATGSIRQAFELQMLAWAGFGLEFARCRACGCAADGAASFFVVSRGGIVCERCRPTVAEGAVRVGAPSVSALSALSSGSIEDAHLIGNGGGDGALAIARFIGSIIDRKLRTLELLDATLDRD